MRTLSLQEMPHGYELETPSFGYWLKAGIAFSLGAGIVTMTGMVLYYLFLFNVVVAFLRAVVAPH